MIRFLVVVLLVAIAIYLLVRFLDGRREQRFTLRQHNPTRRVIAPDDDEQFLRDLERRRREERPPDA